MTALIRKCPCPPAVIYPNDYIHVSEHYDRLACGLFTGICVGLLIPIVQAVFRSVMETSQIGN
jgi:hypothetical protein